MQDSYWEKRLVDGSAELGSNKMIEQKLASWTRGRQDIISTSLFFQGQLVRITCLPNNRTLASWKQLDNYMFVPSAGGSRILSREIWCTPNGYRAFSRIRNPKGSLFITFGDEFRFSVPDSASFLVCSIGIDGKVSYRWS